MTAESLIRMRGSAPTKKLSALLERDGFSGVFGTKDLGNLLLAVKKPETHRPITYSEAMEFVEITGTVESLLTRAALVLKSKQSERLAMIGQLGAGVAHEIRNPLSAIKAFALLAGEEAGDPILLSKLSSIIPDEIARLENLSQQLLELTEIGPTAFEPLDINRLALETIELLELRLKNARVSVASDLAGSLEAPHGDRAAIRQILLNLFINAIEALEEIEGARRIVVRAFNQGSAVVFEVADNGPGISPSVQGRLFRPFSTSKANGTGLGLSICAKIVKKHGGTLKAQPAAEGGALFSVWLPVPRLHA